MLRLTRCLGGVPRQCALASGRCATLGVRLAGPLCSNVVASFSTTAVPAPTTPSFSHSSSSSSSRGSAWALLGALVGSASLALWYRSNGSQQCAAEAAGGAAGAAPPTGRSLYAWGSNQFGSLGLGDETARSLPSLVTGLPAGCEVTLLVACDNVAGVLTSRGEVFTMGRGNELALGHGDQAMVTRPRLVEGLQGKRIVHLAMSGTHGAAVEAKPDGSSRVWCWGSRALGLPPPPPPPAPKTLRGSISSALPAPVLSSFASAAPVELVSLADKSIVSLACGKNHTLALSADGRVFSFGADKYGALGLGDGKDIAHVPTLIPGLEGHHIVAVAAGNGSSLFLTSRGEVLAAGSNEFGQAGLSSNARRYSSPTLVRALRDTVQVSAGSHHTFAVDSSGRAVGWGFNQSGQLGLGHRNFEIRQPTPLPLTTTVARATAGFETTAIVTQQGQLFMQGRGREGQLGRGDQVESIAAVRDSPVQVTFFSSTGQSVVQAAVGADFTLALVREEIDPATAATHAATAITAARDHRRH